MKTDKEKNPGKCPHIDCVNKTICSADCPNELCYEKENPVIIL